MRRIARIVAAASIGWLLAGPAAAACTQGESEEKLRALVAAMDEAQARDPAKVAEIRRKFDEAVDKTLQPSSDPEKATNELCQALDTLMAALQR